MKWLMILRIVVIFWPVVQKLFAEGVSGGDKTATLDQAAKKAVILFPKFEKVQSKMKLEDYHAIIELARLINEAYPDEETEK